MATTEHQRRHLKAVIKDAEDSLLEDDEGRGKLAAAKAVDIEDWNDYTSMVIKDAQKMLDDDDIPADAVGTNIHDYLEKKDVATRLEKEKKDRKDKEARERVLKRG